MARTHRKGLGALLCVINVAVPLSMDMYTPAVPQMASNLSTTDAAVGQTLMLFFLASLVGMLLSGPQTDKYGRKPVLTVGTGFFFVGSAGCAFSPGIELLLACRVVSGLGAGAMITAANAIVRDAYDESARTRILAAMQVVMMIGPVVAPVLGAVVLQFLSWRAVFGVITVFGAVLFVWSLIADETLPAEQRSDLGVLSTMKGLLTVAKDCWFMRVLMARNVYCIAWMGYVACAAFVLENHFGFTPAQYSFAFAFVGLLSSLAPIVFGAVVKRFGVKRCVGVALVAALCLAAVFALVGRGSWIPFVVVLGACFALGTAIQPSLANVLLSSRNEDIGSASAMLAAFPQAMGTVGMFLVTLPLFDYLGWMALLTVGSLVISLAAWLSVAYCKDARGFGR